MAELPYRSLLYIPTHRPATAAIEEALAEVAWVAANDIGSAVFCLIENQLEFPVSRTHHDLLEERATSLRVAWLQVSEARAGEFVLELLDKVRATAVAKSRLHRLLLPPGLSYGRGPNLASLLSEALGCKLLHRRDSDVFRDPVHPEPMPITLELEVVGKPLTALADSVRRLDEFTPAQNAAVRIVGTSSFGAPTIDRRDLATAGIEFLTDLQSLGRPGVDRARVARELADYLLIAPLTRYAETFFEIDIDNRVEMECCCFSEVFRYLPEMPTDIIGCDYMMKDAVWRSQDGLVFHSRKVQHEYSPDRAGLETPETATDYALRDLMYLQMGRIWLRHTTQMQGHWEAHPGIDSFDAAVYTRSFLSASSASVDVLRDLRVSATDIYASAASSARGSVGARLQATATALASCGSALDDHVRTSLDDYCFLIGHWAEIMEAARDSRTPHAWLRVPN